MVAPVKVMLPVEGPNVITGAVKSSLASLVVNDP